MDNIKQVPIIIGIAVLFTLFITLSIEAFYTSPKYDDFCNPQTQAKLYREPYPAKIPPTNCTDIYSTDQRVQSCYNQKGNPIFDYDSIGCQVYKECDYCQRDYDDARKIHDRNIFLITAPLGLIAIIFGLYFGIDFIGSGFMFGGIATLFYGTVRYFGEANKYLRVLIILIELLIVVWIGYKKLWAKQKHKK